MDFYTNALFSLSIGIPALIAALRFRKIDPVHFPFLFLMWLGLLNEITSILLLMTGRPNVVNYNLYTLAESLIITWQFRRWNLFDQTTKLFYSLQIGFIVFWVLENLIITEIFSFSSYFIIAHSFVLVLLSVHMINQMIFTESQLLFRYPPFLICLGFIFYFTFSVLVEAFWLFGLKQSKEFRVGIYQILSYINLFTNLLFALAILWMPMKRQYILQS